MATVLALVGSADGVLTDHTVTAADVIGSTAHGDAAEQHLSILVVKVCNRLGWNPELVSWESITANAARVLGQEELTCLMARGSVLADSLAHSDPAYIY